LVGVDIGMLGRWWWLVAEMMMWEKREVGSANRGRWSRRNER
jgi:hypothetical protein